MKLIFLNFLLFIAKYPKDPNEVVKNDQNILNFAVECDFTGIFDKNEYDINSVTFESLFELHAEVDIFLIIEKFDTIKIILLALVQQKRKIYGLFPERAIIVSK